MRFLWINTVLCSFCHVELHFTQIGGFESLNSSSKNSASFLLKCESLIRKLCASIMATGENHTLTKSGEHGSHKPLLTRCNNNNLLISKISSTCFGQILPVFRSARLRFFTTYGVVSCCCGRQRFGERQRGTTYTVWRKLQCPVVVVGRGSESGNVALLIRYEGSCSVLLLW